MSNENNIRILSDLREQALEVIKKYNELAEKENYETRIGVIDANIDIDSIKEYMAEEKGVDYDELPEDIVIDVRKYMEDNYDHRPYWNTQFPGVKEDCWCPS